MGPRRHGPWGHGVRESKAGNGARSSRVPRTLVSCRRAVPSCRAVVPCRRAVRQYNLEAILVGSDQSKPVHTPVAGVRTAEKGAREFKSRAVCPGRRAACRGGPVFSPSPNSRQRVPVAAGSVRQNLHGARKRSWTCPQGGRSGRMSGRARLGLSWAGEALNRQLWRPENQVPDKARMSRADPGGMPNLVEQRTAEWPGRACRPGPVWGSAGQPGPGVRTGIGRGREPP